MKRYVVGFVQDIDGQRVLLIRKNRPHFLAGLLNGVGGKIEEDDQNPQTAMTRECLEECELFIPPEDWLLLGEMGDQKTYEVFVFGALGVLDLAKTLTDEDVVVMPWAQFEAWGQEGKFAPHVHEMLASFARRAPECVAQDKE